jgi:malate dehydrogenase (oxaloacetate-decarboxylating)
MQPTPTASYSLTLRVRLSSRAGSLGELTVAIGRAGGDIGAIDIVTVGNDYIIRDITVSSVSSKHGEQIVEAVRAVDGVGLLHVSDPTFPMHLGGKIEVVSKVPLKTRADLSMAYTPGVARVCDAIAKNPEKAFTLTIKKNKPERGAGNCSLRHQRGGCFSRTVSTRRNECRRRAKHG